MQSYNNFIENILIVKLDWKFSKYAYLCWRNSIMHLLSKILIRAFNPAIKLSSPNISRRLNILNTLLYCVVYSLQFLLSLLYKDIVPINTSGIYCTFGRHRCKAGSGSSSCQLVAIECCQQRNCYVTTFARFSLY